MTPVVDVNLQNAIEAEARAWIIQLDGDKPSAEDLAALREWAGRSARHYAALRAMAEQWGSLDDLSVLRPAFEAAERTPAPAARRARGSLRAIGLALSVTVICSISLYMYLSGRTADSEPQIYATAVGEQQRVELADGSSIQLNTGTVVEVDYRRDARRIRLIEGESLFDVAHDPSRPFVVAAARGAVRAVGTSFSVRLRREEIVVIVSEGTVGIINDADRRTQIEAEPAALITTGQAAVISGANLATQTIDPQELARRLSWSRGELSFEGEPLAQVLEEMSRYTDLRFDIADPELAQLPIGGRFPISDTERWIDALSAYGIEVVRESNIVRLSRPQSG